MQTLFTEAQRQNPTIQDADAILRKCVHCGFCTATCPTFVTLGDELDSPRGRIYQIKTLLEEDKKPDEEFVTHMDRCLSCLSCTTTCPSGVDYMHLIDQTRAKIEEEYERPIADRALRNLLEILVPNPKLFRFALLGAMLARPFKKALPKRLKAMVELAPKSLPKPSILDCQSMIPAVGERKGRVLLLLGCAQRALSPDINDSSISLLSRSGFDVVMPQSMGCCGSLTHHMGKEDKSHAQAAHNIRIFMEEMRKGPIDAIIINASGCGTTVKDYGYMFRRDATLKQDAETVSTLAKDITEFMDQQDLPKTTRDLSGIRVAYHSACSMQHGQKLKTPPISLLKKVGFEVTQPRDSHLCCGSAGTYNMLQPELADQLLEKKIKRLEDCKADIIAAGNIGCIGQIGKRSPAPIHHTAELLDWATGGDTKIDL